MTPFRTLLVAIAASVTTTLLVVGGVAMANDRFSDVASFSAFHEAINDFTDAGCATGFPNGTYHPTDPVNRQQVARMFQACGGRAAFAEQGVSDMGDEIFLDVASVTVEAGALGVGGGFIVVIGTVEGELVSGAAPCEISATLEQTGGNSGGDDSIRVNIFDTGETDEVVGTLLDVIPVDAGDVVEVHISTRVDNSPNCDAQVVNADYALSATYHPFAGDGSGGGA